MHKRRRGRWSTSHVKRTFQWGRSNELHQCTWQVKLSEGGALTTGFSNPEVTDKSSFPRVPGNTEKIIIQKKNAA